MTRCDGTGAVPAGRCAVDRLLASVILGESRVHPVVSVTARGRGRRQEALTRHIDTSIRRANNRTVQQRTKRTYRISPEAQARVRELAAKYGVGASQDAVVETAVNRLYRDVEAQAEANRWRDAAGDPDFRAEATELAGVFDGADTWPA